MDVKNYEDFNWVCHWKLKNIQALRFSSEKACIPGDE